MADRVLIDTDTASDDAVALLLCARSDRVEIEAVTAVAGNVGLERAAENAKYTLDLAGAEAAVHEGAGEPLVKSLETAEEVHGEGGLGGNLRPETGIPSGGSFGPDRIVEAARAPGEVDLLCLGPLTNVALALRRDPDLGEGFSSVWVMGGAANTLGNVTPAAEFNAWVDPDAAKAVLRALDVTLVDWGLCRRDGVLREDDLDRIAAADTAAADFVERIVGPSQETSARRGVSGVIEPDPLAAALYLDPALIESAGRHHVDVDEREGITRGYTLVDEEGVLDAPARTRVIESADPDGFRRMVLDAVLSDPQ